MKARPFEWIDPKDIPRRTPEQYHRWKTEAEEMGLEPGREPDGYADWLRMQEPSE